MGGSSSAKVDTIGRDVEEEIRHGLFCWARYFDGRDAYLRPRSRRRGGSREQGGVDSGGDLRRTVESADLPSHRVRDWAYGANPVSRVEPTRSARSLCREPAG